MKKILFLLLLIPAMTFAQRETITVTASMDTTIWIVNNNKTLLEIDITGLSANTDSLWVGYSNDKGGFVAATGYPIVCDKNTIEQYVNGSWVNRTGTITTGNWPGVYVVIRYKVVDSAAGSKWVYNLDR